MSEAAEVNGTTLLVAAARARLSLPDGPERQRIREAAGISQRKLGKALGVSWTAIQRWEDGATPREDAMIVAYAGVLAELKEIVG